MTDSVRGEGDAINVDSGAGNDLITAAALGTDRAALTLTGNIPWVDRDFAWKQHNLNVAHTWTMGPSMFNQLRGTYVRQFGAITMDDPGTGGKPPIHIENQTTASTGGRALRTVAA